MPLSLDLNFTAIDFETADELIPCELGVCVVHGGVIAERRSWLIKPICYPYMNFWNENIHGIGTRDLADAPYFDAVWPEIRPYLEDRLLVAHNAKFDISVLYKALNHYRIVPPPADYLCSVRMARRIWPEMESHRLSVLCQRFGITFRHHRAGDDAEACARIMLHIANDTQKRKTASTLQLSLDLFRPAGMSIKEIARELKIKPQKLSSLNTSRLDPDSGELHPLRFQPCQQ
jgi:DNA polymerase-3 subunit epsilon